jgi:hypothetical protein
MTIDMKALAAKAKAQKAALQTNGADQANNPVIGRNGRPVPQVFANIGVSVDMPDEDGVLVPQFFSSNIGAPVDFVERLTSNANSSDEWKSQVMMQHAFMDKVEAATANLEVGETVILDVPLTVAIQLRRVNPNKKAPAAGEMSNEVAGALAAMNA